MPRSAPRTLTLKDVQVSSDWMVGTPGQAFAMISHFFDINRAVIGWQIGDGSEEVMKLLIARSRFGREAFKAPIRHETDGS
jgi:alkylation response protein AidB-like acyl-CoA dehydrogenase